MFRLRFFPADMRSSGAPFLIWLPYRVRGGPTRSPHSRITSTPFFWCGAVLDGRVRAWGLSAPSLDVAHRVYVSHLRNNRLFLRRTCDVL